MTKPNKQPGQNKVDSENVGASKLEQMNVEVKQATQQDYKSFEPQHTKEDLITINLKLNSQLEQVRNQLDQFEHSISHTVQEPLRKITIFSRKIKENAGNKPDELKEFADKIDAASSRLRNLLDDLQSFARISNYEKLLEKINLKEVLDTTLVDLELLIEEKGAKIVVSELPVIEAIPFQIGQLFYNIIHNALKFSNPEVNTVIEINYRKLTKKEVKLHGDLDEKLRFYLFAFKDNGIGFDQKYAVQIFTMFQRLGSGTEHAGTGMGLAISKKIVHNYYGKIYAEGVEGESATINVILPFEQPRESLDDDITMLRTWV